MRLRLPYKQTALAAALCAAVGSAQAAKQAAPASLEEMWKIIQAQQAEIDRLKKQTHATEQKVEATGEILEQQVATASSGGGGSKTTIGGYGELHYNNLERGDGSNIDEIDLHRFVLYFGHEFNERIRLVTELEVEHGGVEADGNPLDGEVEVEQAYVEMDFTENVSGKAGVYLIPVGILNETHEPTTFYGVERNPVENIIVPSTWWAGGAAVSARFDNGISTDFGIHSGLEIPTTGSSAFRIRSGRQKVSNAKADDLAMTGRIKYTGIAGLELAGSLHFQNDITQKNGDGAEEATLFEAHAIWNRGPFTAKALYAGWDIDGDDIKAADGDKQDGYYVEGGYKLTNNFGVFARYNDVDGVRVQDEFEQFDVGFNWWPHEDVVIKMDYMDRENDSDSDRDLDGFNIGVGYQF
jgi:hypothetical protein